MGRQMDRPTNRQKTNDMKDTNGYLPKIVHHMLQGNFEKVEYFVKRQEDVYGPLTAKQKNLMAKMYFEADHKIN